MGDNLESESTRRRAFLALFSAGAVYVLAHSIILLSSYPIGEIAHSFSTYPVGSLLLMLSPIGLTRVTTDYAIQIAVAYALALVVVAVPTYWWGWFK